jgi:hypothetical protein
MDDKFLMNFQVPKLNVEMTSNLIEKGECQGRARLVLLVDSLTRQLIEAFVFGDQSVFKDDSAFLIALALLRREFIHPPEFCLAVFAHDVAYHVSSCEHHTILNIAECKIDDFFEEICAAC